MQLPDFTHLSRIVVFWTLSTSSLSFYPLQSVGILSSCVEKMAVRCTSALNSSLCYYRPDPVDNYFVLDVRTLLFLIEFYDMVHHHDHYLIFIHIYNYINLV